VFNVHDSTGTRRQLASLSPPPPPQQQQQQQHWRWSASQQQLALATHSAFASESASPMPSASLQVSAVGVADGVGFSAGVCFAAGVAAAAGVGVAAMAPPALWRAGRRVEGPDQDDGGESMRMRPCRDAPPRAQSEKPHNVEGKRYWRWPPRTAKGRATNR